MLEDFQGDSWGSIPPLRMSSLLPHDLCHGRSASLWPPTVNLLSQEHSWLLSRHLCVCSYTRNVGAKGARFFPWGADALWQSTCLRIHQLTLPSPWQRSHCCSPWQFGKKRTLTFHKVGPCPSLKGKARAELRPIRRQSSLTYSRSLLLHGK